MGINFPMAKFFSFFIDSGHSVMLLPIFEDFAVTLGIVPKVFRVRRPQTKDKVERSVSFIKDNFIPGRKFTDFGDLKNQALKWCLTV